MISKAGGVALIVVSLCCGIGSVFLFRGYQTVEEVIQSGERQVNSKLVPAMKSWNAQDWEPLWADGLRQAIPDRQGFLRLFADRLGPLQTLGAPTYRAIRPAPPGMGAKSVVELRYLATFSRGQADLRVKMARIDKEWKIASFSLGDPNVPPPASN